MQITENIQTKTHHMIKMRSLCHWFLSNTKLTDFFLFKTSELRYIQSLLLYNTLTNVLGARIIAILSEE